MWRARTAKIDEGSGDFAINAKKLAAALLSICAIAASVFTVAGVRANPSLREKLERLELGDIWVKLDAFEPNVFFAMQPGARANRLHESYFTVQQHPLENRKIHELKARLESGVRPGEKFGEWTIDQVKRTDGCFELVLTNSREVQQKWCFGRSAAVVVTEIGPSRVDEKLRQLVHRIVKEGAK